MDALLNLCTGLGLSGAAGLNAYIPLLTLSVMANRGIVHLAAPYDVIGQWWCMLLLIVLLVIEIVVDKIPGADHVNDMLQTFIRPTAGAILFGSQAGIIHSVHPSIWIIIGLLMSGGVHTAKSLARPPINLATVGLGAPIVSTIEDLVSTVLAIVAILVPIVAVVLMGVFGWILWRMFRAFFRRRSPQAVRVLAVAVESPESAVLPAEAVPTMKPSRWGGGV